jgi:hypothetical protein
MPEDVPMRWAALGVDAAWSTTRERIDANSKPVYGSLINFPRSPIMADKKTTPAGKKTAARARKGSTIKMTLAVDPQKLEAIQRCLKKGKLTITMSTADILKAGRAENGYLYD